MACSLPLAARMESTPFISVVVPVFNEEANAPVLVQAVRDALAAAGTWELILVDDGSSDRTREVIGALAAVDARVRLIPLARNYGQSTAMQAGFDHAGGDSAEYGYAAAAKSKIAAWTALIHAFLAGRANLARILAIPEVSRAGD